MGFFVEIKFDATSVNNYQINSDEASVKITESSYLVQEAIHIRTSEHTMNLDHSQQHHC